MKKRTADCSCWQLLLNICTHKLRTMFRKNCVHLIISVHLKLKTPSIKQNYCVTSTFHTHLILSSLPSTAVHVPSTVRVLSSLSASDDRHACALSASEVAGTQCCSMQCSSSNGRWPHIHSCSTAMSQKLKSFPSTLRIFKSFSSELQKYACALAVGKSIQ
jgi:hypothetical protein